MQQMNSGARMLSVAGSSLAIRRRERYRMRCRVRAGRGQGGGGMGQADGHGGGADQGKQSERHGGDQLSERDGLELRLRYVGGLMPGPGLELLGHNNLR